MNMKLWRVAGVVLVALLLVACSGDAETSNPTVGEGPTAVLAPPTNARRATQKSLGNSARIILLHHSTGQCVWDGGVEAWFDAHNRANGTQYRIVERAFPESDPYGWNNYPFDYWNIWVRHAGHEPYQNEPTLEMLTSDHDVIVFKHCFPVSNIEPDTGSGDVASEEKRFENYRLQYEALKKKLQSFPDARFVVWTAAAQVRGDTDEAQAQRAKSFVDWVKTLWDEPGDNIYVWDFHALETEGGLYLKPDYAQGDAHPNESFSQRVAPLLAQRIVDVIAGAGDTGNLTGNELHPGPTATETVATRAETSPVISSENTPSAPDVRSVPRTVVPAAESYLFDDAEDPQRRILWPSGAAYVADADGHVINIDFTKGRQEDWGEYGIQRIIATKPQPEDVDIRRYRYVAFRIRTDRDMDINFTLVTDGDRSDESYFGFTAYPEVEANRWNEIVLDLNTMELGAEGAQAYAAAGEPRRPMVLTQLKLVTHERNAQANVAIDDITFHQTLP